MRRLIVAALLLGASVAEAAPPTVDELLNRIDASAVSIDTLSGEFVQRNRLKLFKQELHSEGRLLFHRPRQIRWEYLRPDPSTLILDDKLATLSTPGGEAQTFDLERDPTMRIVFDQLLVWLGTGPKDKDKLAADYTLATVEQKGQPTLILTPLPTSTVSKVFSRIELRLDAKTSLLRSLLLIERAGDEKEIVFQKLLKNAKLPGDAFARAKR